MNDLGILFPGQGNEASQPLADNIKSMVFTYYEYLPGTGMVEIELEGDPPAVPDTSLIKKIRVTLVSETEELVDRSEKPTKKKEFQTESDIFLRNREVS